MIVKPSIFAGIAPRFEPRKLAESQATIAENVDLQSGALVPINNCRQVYALPDATRKTIFPYNDGYLSWATDVNVRRGPITDDQYDRIYYTGDGVPKVRGIVNNAEVEYPLGVPAPTAAPTFVVRQKSTAVWTRRWKCFYEESDGSKKDAQDLDEGNDATDVAVIQAGKIYRLTTPPARVTASATAVFVLYFDAYDANNANIGRVYPDVSAAEGTTDLYINGARVTSLQTTAGGVITLTLAYDTSRVTDFAIDRNYVYTYVTAFGEEGPPSDPSETGTVDPSQDAQVSGILEPPTGYNITTKRIYRTITSNEGTSYRLVAEITDEALTYLDDVSDTDAELDTLPSLGWLAPPEDLIGLVYHPGGFFAGFREGTREIYFCEPFQPHAWPVKYSVTSDLEVVALGVSGNAICILTKGPTTIMAGDRPDTLSKYKPPSTQGCISKRGVTEFEGLVVFPSPDGLCAISYANGTADVITKEFIVKDEGYPLKWSDINPETMIGAIYDRRYHGWTSTHAIIFGLYEGPSSLTTTTQTAAGAHYDEDDDSLLLIDGSNIVAWREGDGTMSGRWRSREILVSRPWAPSAARVLAESYPQILRIFAEKQQVLELTADNDRLFKLPRLRSEKAWQFELVPTARITEALITTSAQELDIRNG